MTVMLVTLAFSALAKRTPCSTAFMDNSEPSVGMRMCLYMTLRLRSLHNFIPEYAAFLGYASPKGHALIDRRLYLPKDWIEDAERRKAANIPADLTFASKPKIGIAIVAAALDAGVPCA